MKIIKSRKETTTKGPDPTVVVKWTITDPATGRVIYTEEFQGIIKGGGADDVLDEMVAQLIHEGLEADYELNERMKAEN